MTAKALLCGRAAPPVASMGHEVTLVPDLCAHPGDIADAAGGADRLVLGVCAGQYSRGRLQAEVRRLGIDPLGMELVTLEEAAGDPARLDLLLTAATARAEAFAGSEPRHSKLSFADQLSRRDVLGALRPEYRAAPGITPERCVADDGCRACVDACPRRAYRWAGGHVAYDRAICEPCGVCVTTCPVGAITNPAITPAQLDAQVRALLDPVAAASGPRGIAFVCSRGDVAVDAPGWYGIRVPCTAMVTATWLLAPLLLGAGAVALLPCAASGCPLALDQLTRTTADFVAELLRHLGAGERLRPAPAGQVPGPWTAVALDHPFAPLGGAEVLAGLAAAAGTSLPGLAHPRSPVGVVTIDPGTCTLCGRCAASCPPGALEYRAGAQEAELSFDAARCTGCGQCVPRCPELQAGAITVERRVAATALAASRKVVAASSAVQCEACGGPVASAPLLRQLRERLGPEHRATFRAVAGRCPGCRSTSRHAITPE